MVTSVVIMFHDVVAPECATSGFLTTGAQRYKINADSFEKIVNACSELSIPVVYSFDDGGVSFYNIIAPVLEKCGERGIFCISTKYLDTPNFLTSDQVRELHEKGHTIASHSHSHPRNMSSLSYEQLRFEWKKSKEILETIIGNDVTVASIPNGSLSNNVLSAINDAGYKSVFTSVPSISVKVWNNLRITGRFAVLSTSKPNEIVKVITSPALRTKLIFKYWILRGAKSLLGKHYNVLKEKIICKT